MKRLIQISDTHLSRTHAYTYPNWQAVLKYIHQTQPDLVIHTGDHVLGIPEDMDDLVFARQQMDQLQVDWKSLPGDHDIGGGPPQPRLRPEVPWLEHYTVTEERLERYLKYFSVDRWAVTFEDWYLIGLNDLIFESGFDREAEQWQFLGDHLLTAVAKPIALFMHKPPCVLSLGEQSYVTNAIPAQARRRLQQMIASANVRLIATGHIHVYRTLHTMGLTVVAAPTLMRGKDDYVSRNGLSVNGLVEYTFEGDSVEFRLVSPPGVEHLDLPEGARYTWAELPVERLNDG